MNKTRSTLILSALIVIAGAWAAWEMQLTAATKAGGGIGPDVIVGAIPSVRRWGTTGGFTSYTIGTTSCNIGDERMDWIQNNNIHPVISQNLYRVQDGRIEMLGCSWLKHGFAVAAGSLCNQCTDPAGTYLGVGCSDPYGSSLNGNQGLLGPRSQVNASTGVFPYPHADLPQTGTLDGRIRVANSEIEPSQNAGARYFVESEYIHPQDAASGNSNNNASYREAVFSSGGGGIQMGLTGITFREEPAINAWKQVHDDVRLFNVDIPDDGRVVVGIRTVPNGSGGFTTNVAVENLTSHRAIRSLSMKFGSDTISAPGFNDVEYQFEPYASTDWASSINGDEIEWSAGTGEETANAIRWSTMYSFWADADTCPSELTLGILRPGTPTEVTLEIPALPNPATGLNISRGAQVGGSMTDVLESNDTYIRFNPGFTISVDEAPVWLLFDTTVAGGVNSCLDFVVESQANTPGLTKTVESFNWNTGQFEVIATAAESFNSDVVLTTDVSDNIENYVDSLGNVLSRVGWRKTGFTLFFPWEVRVDNVTWMNR